MNAVEKLKLNKALKTAILARNNATTALQKLKLSKEVQSLRQQLGLVNKKTEPQEAEVPNVVFQAVLGGEKTLSIETLDEVIVEVENNPKHYQAVPATQKLLDAFKAQHQNNRKVIVRDIEVKRWEKGDILRWYVNMQNMRKGYGYFEIDKGVLIDEMAENDTSFINLTHIDTIKPADFKKMLVEVAHKNNGWTFLYRSSFQAQVEIEVD